MLASLTLIAFGIVTAILAFPVEAHADGGQIIDKATGTKFEGITHVETQSFKCMGAGVRKLVVANVYAVAFCVEAAHAELRGDPRSARNPTWLGALERQWPGPGFP